MNIQYCSDLHLEFAQNSKYLKTNPLRVCGDILILAGDIVPLHDEFLNDPFFSFISSEYKQVYWVPGNHEFYYKNISDYSPSYNIQIHKNINIVNNISLVYDGIQFIFSTLWSNIRNTNEKFIEQRVSDFDCITNNGNKFRVADYNKLHSESLRFIKDSIQGKPDKVVVVTHHVPSKRCNTHAHRLSLINEAFCVDLTEWIKTSNINFWIYGHNHNNQKPLFVGKTIMLTNQLGYVMLGEQNNFRRNAFFSI